MGSIFVKVKYFSAFLQLSIQFNFLGVHQSMLGCSDFSAVHIAVLAVSLSIIIILNTVIVILGLFLLKLRSQISEKYTGAVGEDMIKSNDIQ